MQQGQLAEPAVLAAVKDGVAHIKFNRPERLNAIDPDLASLLASTLRNAISNAAIRVIILKGAGGTFMAGGDVVGFHRGLDEPLLTVNTLIKPFHEVISTIRTSPKPVIAAVEGAAAGGGVSIALTCDFVLAEPDAVFTPGYLRLGTTPDGGLTLTASRLLGERKALEWLMIGEPMGAEEAAHNGLINWVVPIGTIDQAAEALAFRLIAGSANAQSNLKRLIWRAGRRSFNKQLAAEENSFCALCQTPDFKEGVTSFVERRAPRFANTPGPLRQRNQ